MARLYYIFIAVFVLVSCGNQRKTLSPSEYISWVKRSETSLVKQKSVNGYHFTLKFQPVELLILRSGEEKISAGFVDSVKKIQEGTLNFVLDIGSSDGTQSLLKAHLKTEDEYFKRVYYYTSEVQHDLYLLEGKDTLPCRFYHFEQTFNISPVNSLVMEFERKNKQAPYDDISFVYEDRVLNAGIIKFLYKKSFLNQLPELKVL